MDLRIRRSKQFLWQAFFTLMTQEKQLFDTITINQICEKALVHRSTFYAHFEDKYDLLRFGFNQLWADYLILPASERALTPFKTANLFFINSTANQLITEQKRDILFTEYSKQYFFQLMKEDACQLINHNELASILPNDLFLELYLSTLETLSTWSEKHPEKAEPIKLDLWFRELLQIN